MGCDEDGGQERLAASDVIRFGPARPRSRRWPGWLALSVLLTAVLTAVLTRGEGSPARPPVRVTEIGHRLLGVRSGWDLFGLGPSELIRIQLARGRITRTAIPGLQDTGPVFLVAGPGQSVIRPLDLVPGYLVSDGQPARHLPAVLSHGGFAGPGPRPGEGWVLAVGSTRLSLVSLATGNLRMSVPLPPVLPGSGWLATPDGRGGVLLDTNGSFYDAGPNGARLLTFATIVAVGPTRWLTTSCAPSGRCVNVVITFASGTRRVLPGPDISTGGSLGAVSPDGSIAAVFVPSAAGGSVLQLIYLRSGATRLLPVAVEGPSGSSALVWSPDSRWLFTVAANGKLRAVNARTGLIRSLDIALPPMTQLAVRNVVHPP